MAQWVKIARRGEVPESSGRVIEVQGRKLALFHSGGQFYATDNSCKHRGGPLGEGEVYGTRVVCPWHGWEYDFSTGCNVDDPAMKLACFPVKVDGDDVLVEV